MKRRAKANPTYVSRDGLEDHHVSSQLLGSGSGDRHPHPQRLRQQVKAKYAAHNK